MTQPPPFKPPQPVERYPALQRYLRVIRFVAAVIAYCGLLAAVGLFITAIRMDSRSFAVIVQALIVLASSAFWYVACMAGIEFVEVVLDIEANTRAAIGSRRGPDRSA